MDFYVKEVIYFKATEVDEKEVCRLCNFFDEKIKAIKGKYVYASSFRSFASNILLLIFNTVVFPVSY